MFIRSVEFLQISKIGVLSWKSEIGMIYYYLKLFQNLYFFE